MIAQKTERRNGFPLYAAGLLMPYLSVGLGLHVLHSAWAAILAYHAGIALTLWGAGASRGTSFRIAAAWWKILPLALFGLAAGVALHFLWPALSVPASLPATLARWGLTSTSWPWFIGYSALVNPWLEELYWRGWLGSATRLPVAHDAAFAGFHLIILAPFVSIAWLSAAFLILSFTAWLWRQVTRRAQSLLPAALCHLLADVSILFAIVSEIA